MENQTLMSLTIQERKLFYLLRGGSKYSVPEISQRLWLADPRSVIRCLRNKGLPIEDEWRKTNDGKRYKVFFVRIK